MRRFLCAVLLIANASFAAFGQAPVTRNDDRTQSQVAIEKLMGSVAEVWNRHDVVAFSMLFAEDADFTNWRGDLRAHGREEIRREHAEAFAGMFNRSRLTVVSTRIRFFSSDVAAVQCEWELVGTIDYDGKGTIPPRTYFPLLIVTRAGGNWSIAVMHNVLFQPLPPGAIVGPVKQ